jgi:hypothetical protein
VPVKVGEAQLGAGVGVLAAADRPGACWPGVQVDPAGQLAHLGVMAGLAVGVDCWGPGRLGLGQDRRAEVGVDRHAHREPHTLLAQLPSQPGAGPGAVASDQDRLVTGGGGQLREARSTSSIRSAAPPAGALPGPSRPASGSPGAWPRSR